jgi:hypothetical protein
VLVTGKSTIWVVVPVKYCCSVLVTVKVVVPAAVIVVLYPEIILFPEILLLAFIVVKDPDPGVLEPIEPGDANVAPFNVLEFKFATTVEEVTLIEVKAPLPGVPVPMLPGLAKVNPLRLDALRFATFVLDDTAKGAVPVLNVLVKIPLAFIVVKDPDPGVLEPIEPGDANVLPLSKEQFKFATLVELVTINGAVPWDNVLVS